jgi:hypothetical protein
MLSDERPGRAVPSRKYTPEERAFDELARGLANRSITRRQAFKLFSGAVLGGVLASIPGVAALAQSGGGNSAAAHFCSQLPPGPLRGQCASDATKGQGLFFECGGDLNRLCGTVCCGANEACVGGTCTSEQCTPGSGTAECPGGLICCILPNGATFCGTLCENANGQTCCRPNQTCHPEGTGSPVCV